MDKKRVSCGNSFGVSLARNSWGRAIFVPKCNRLKMEPSAHCVAQALF